MDVKPAIGSDTQQSVVAPAACAVVAEPDTETASLAATYILGLAASFGPVECSCTLIECFADECAGHRSLTTTLEAIAVEDVVLAELDAIHADRLSQLVSHGRQYGSHFVLPRPPLSTARGGVGVNRYVPEPHVFRLVSHGDVLRGGISAAPAGHTAIINNHQINCRYLAICLDAGLDPALHARAGRTDVELLFSRDSKLHRSIQDPGKVAGYRHVRIWPDFGAKAAAGGLIDEDQILQRDIQHACQTGVIGTLALGRTVEIAFPVFPVSHTGSCFQRMVRIAHGDKRLFNDRCSLSKARFDIAEGPFIGEFSADRFLTRPKRINGALRPFDAFDLSADDGRAFRTLFLRSHQRVAFGIGIGTIGRETLQRVDDEIPALEINSNAVKRSFGDFFRSGRHCQNRLTDIGDVVRRQSRIGRGRDRWEVIGSKYPDHTVHAKRS